MIEVTIDRWPLEHLDDETRPARLRQQTSLGSEPKSRRPVFRGVPAFRNADIVKSDVADVFISVDWLTPNSFDNFFFKKNQFL